MNKEPLSAGDIWRFQQDLTNRLSLGAGVSIVLGLGMLALRSSLWNGIALQFIAWALVDLVIALAGGSLARKKESHLSPEERLSTQQKEARSLAKVLWVNTVLDVFYMLGGALVAALPGSTNPFWLGTGIGILCQGAFLFFFDWYHALQARKFVP